MLEKDFQGKIKRSFDLYRQNHGSRGFYKKFRDMGYYTPFDCQLIIPNKYVALELKINKAKNTFNFKTFFNKVAHELKYLQEVSLCGHSAFVLILHCPNRSGHRCYALTISKALEYYKLGSTKLTDAFIEIPRIRNEFRNESVWDLSKIL